MSFLARAHCVYVSDSGRRYDFVTTLENIAANQATPVTTPTEVGLPRRARPRMVIGFDPSGNKVKLPILRSDNSIYAGGTVLFRKNNLTVTVWRRTQEFFPS